eukprot:gnl/Chilomastix_caulleri/509.p1 GENE.gnl/Chilomastix_caulleri/509~~gnl/Chilomastix_caulleri/509.p1  ORF type:complete len:220 (+),score=44.40 gnl/Chilomastix_caulleri/509:557-1216(+)
MNESVIGDNCDIFESISGFEGPVKEFTEKIIGDDDIYQNDKQRIKDKLGEFRSEMDDSIKHISEVHDGHVINIDNLSKLISDELIANREHMPVIMDNFGQFDAKHSSDCKQLSSSIGKLADQYQYRIDTIVKNYMDEISQVDIEFMKELPANMKQLEVDADELNSAVLETKMQVKSHATQLSAMRTLLRDLASVSGKAFESSSKLIGRVRSDEPISRKD